MTRRLYVIGNGFDLHHGVPSSYGAFGRYVRAEDREVHRTVEDYLFGDNSDVWADFEGNLANLDVDALTDEAQQYLGSYSDDAFSAAAYHDYQWAISEVASALSGKLHGLFRQWLTTLAIPTSGDLPIDPDALFLNFNYTPTLQTAYGVADGAVLHIHGRIGAESGEIILGHGMTLPPSHRTREEDRDFRILEGEAIIRRYFNDTTKPTAAILQREAGFFDALATVSEVWVMGHSIGEVDVPYFEKIRDSVAPGATWKVSYYGDPAPIREQMEAVGVRQGAVTYLTLDRF